MAEVKKYELITDDKINWLGRTLFRIKALISFSTATGRTVNVGDLGGYIEKEGNLNHSGNADYICVHGWIAQADADYNYRLYLSDNDFIDEEMNKCIAHLKQIWQKWKGELKK